MEAKENYTTDNEKKREYRAKINWATLNLYFKSIHFTDVNTEYSKIDRNIIYNHRGYVMCVNCLRKVSIYNIVKKHGMDTALEYAKDGKFYCYTCTPWP